MYSFRFFLFAVCCPFSFISFTRRFGKSDICVVIKYKGKEVARSPVVTKNLNPDWGTVTDRGHVGGHLFEPFVEVFCDAHGRMTEEQKDEVVTVQVHNVSMKMLSDFLGCYSFRAGRLLGMQGTEDVEFALQQKGGGGKASKLVKGSVFLSIENEFNKGGEKKVDGLFSKGMNALNEKTRDQTLDDDATDYSVVDFSSVGHNA